MLSFLLITTLVSLGIYIAFNVLSIQFTYLRRCYFVGVALWSSWLPVFAAFVYILIIAANLLDIASFNQRFMHLDRHMSSAELMILFVIGPLLFTRANHLIGAAAAIYCLERLLLSGSFVGANYGMLLVIGSASTVAILGDKMPWYLMSRPNFTAYRMREVLIFVLSMVFLTATFASIFDFRDFTQWIQRYLSVSVSPGAALLFLIGLFIAWLSVALGLSRHFVLPIISLPSICALAFITQWPAYVLVVPFSLILALAFAIADRRILARL